MRRDKGQNGVATTLKFDVPPSEPASAIQQLHAMVHAAQEKLIDPTAGNVDACRERLDEVLSALRILVAGLPGGEPKRKAALAKPLAALRAEIGRVAMLLDSAAAFHMGWMHMAACMVSGYTANGTPATPEPSRHVSLEV
ncbi:MAG TPA: hypothetical protein VNH83_09125 [Bryobacteraceae bacterium]|nr:hypothetical protein [Bryobacteraceae bacterium]